MIYKLQDDTGNYIGVKNRTLAFIILSSTHNPFNILDEIDDKDYDEKIIESEEEFNTYFY